MSENSILGENEAHFPTIKRIVSRTVIELPDIMRFL